MEQVCTDLHRAGRPGTQRDGQRIPPSEEWTPSQASPPRPLLPAAVYRSPDEERAAEALCAEYALTRSAERLVAEAYVASMTAFHKAEQLEAIHFSEGCSTLEDLRRLKLAAEIKARHLHTALEALRLLNSLRTPSISIVAAHAQIQLSAAAR